jgi:ADP-ribose pyrophosphatase YjhB (NUDIX family)
VNVKILPAGIMAFLFHKNKILLILRDNKPWISFPNVWSPPTGGLEEDETFPECMERELEEEISVIPSQIAILGVSGKGNAYYFGFITDEEAEKITIKDEGQTFKFFKFEELKRLNLGGAFKIYLERFPAEMRSMFSMADLPSQEFGKQLGLAIWDGSTQTLPET